MLFLIILSSSCRHYIKINNASIKKSKDDAFLLLKIETTEDLREYKDSFYAQDPFVRYNMGSTAKTNDLVFLFPFIALYQNLGGEIK